MLLVEVTSESPTDETETKASAPTEENNATATIHNIAHQDNKDNAKERIATDRKVVSEGAVPKIQIEASDFVQHSNTDGTTKTPEARENDKLNFYDQLRVAVAKCETRLETSAGETADSNRQDETGERNCQERKPKWRNETGDAVHNSDTDEETKPPATGENDDSDLIEELRAMVAEGKKTRAATSKDEATDSDQQDETDKLEPSCATGEPEERSAGADFQSQSSVWRRRAAMCDYPEPKSNRSSETAEGKKTRAATSKDEATDSDQQDESRSSQRRRVAMCDYPERKSNRSSETGYVGLVNQAMTCYLNSLLQALYMTPEFRNALYNWEYVNDSEKDETKSIPYQMQKLFLNLQTSSKNAIETTSLTRSFGWDSTEAWQQHDIQELCRVMFDALEQKFKNTAQADLINRLYEGKMIDYVKCLECGTEKSREDSFLDIPLPVRPFGSNVAYGSVEEALAAFVQPETLDGTNQYHCETCNKKCDAHKGLKFTKFPYFLTLHLKRFAFDYTTFHRIKLNDAVTFPDLLNLNSFIPSTAAEDPSDENSSRTAPVKSEDGSTADSGNVEDDRPAAPCNNGISANDDSTSDNREEDEDEGIERNNGPSTSNCHSQNHDDGNNRENLPGPKGPYVYELFSIMIHSGSASGGHYYAYIKDFKTGKWLCFNDQNVSPITNDDIQKTYGGGPLRAYYSGVYSSSSNAYMLMYRQIDPVRNTLPMQVAEFPKHLQKLLIETQDSEDNDMKNRKMPPQMHSLKVYCHHPVKKTTECETLYGFCNTWASFTDRAYEAFNLAGVVDRDQVRLVTYQVSTGLINCSFEDLENEPIRVMYKDQTDFLLEIRKKDESFKTYSPRGIAKNVYAIDMTSRQVTKGPINVRGYPTQTIPEYKEQLALAFGLESKDMNVIFNYTDVGSRLVTNSEDTLNDEGFNSTKRVFVIYSLGSDSEKSLELIDEILGMSCIFMTFNVQLPDLSEEALRALDIPSLLKKKIQDATPSTTGLAKSVVDAPKSTDKTENNVKTTRSNDGDDSSGVSSKATSSPAQMEVEDWHTPEQSNSEDSSLSYSDRTLVGEGDASEDEDYPLANIDHEVSNQTNQDSYQCPDPSEYLYKVTRDEQEPDKLLRVLVEGQMVLSTLKKVLEPYIGVPSEYFRVFRQPDGEIEYSRLSMKTKFYDDGATMWIQLGIALRDDEFKASLYQLCLNSEMEPFRFLCERTFSNDATVAQTKREILAELKKKYDIDIPFERCRLRLKFNDTAGNVFFDNQKMKDIRSYPRFSREIIIQELPGKEPVKKSSDIVCFAKRIPTSGMRKGPLQEFVLEGRSTAELREKILQLSGIPDEHLEIARGGVCLPDDVDLMLQRKRLEFSSEGNDDCQLICIEDGVFIYYRDRRESQIELCPSERQDRCSRNTPRDHVGVISRRSRYSPRNERSLKIYFDDM